MKTSKWMVKLALAAAVAAVGTLPTVGSAQQDVLIPGGPIEYHVEPLEAAKAQLQNVAFGITWEDEKTDQATGEEYWLGLQVAAVPEITKRQLVIKNGLAVEDVAPESPAAKADIKKFDILLKAGDAPLNGVADLIKAVEAAQGKEIVIVCKRDGETHTIRVTADKRPKSDQAVEVFRRAVDVKRPELAAEIKQLEEALEKLKSKAGKDGFGMWFAKPAIVAPRVDVRFHDQFSKDLKADFPKDLSVQINKQGSDPVKIHVKRGDQEWDVTSDKVDDLPQEIRPHVQQLLGRMHVPDWASGGARTLRVSPEGKIEGELRISPYPPRPAVAPVPPVPPNPPKAPAGAAVPASPAKATATRVYAARTERDDDISDKLGAIMKKLDQLQKEIDELREKK